MEQKKARRILYTICFVCLAFIDWIRGSQDGFYWHTAVNLTGFFLSFLIIVLCLLWQLKIACFCFVDVRSAALAAFVSSYWLQI